MAELGVSRQEVFELTALLRHDPRWSELRAAIRGQGLAVEEVVLGGFYESEDEREFGVLATSTGEVIEFERSSEAGSAGFRRWKQVERPSDLLDSFAAVLVAVELARKR